MHKDDIYNNNILNIFCDASTRNRGSNVDVCYGAIAICKDDIIDQLYRVNSNSTNNNAEIKALRAAILLAIRYKNRFSEINIFSDSQISLFGIRDRIFKWKYNKNTERIYGYESEIKSQEVFIEILNMIIDHELKVNLYHQKGHIDINNFTSLKKAAHVFIASNNIRDKVDYNLIRYISINNARVDERTRRHLLSTDIYAKKIIEPIKFIPDINFYDKLNQYYNIKNGGTNYVGQQKY